jgi:colanic acid biosynthesis glycosyl transferase WcaI
MRILILSINYWPEATGIGAFTAYRAEYLASEGHDVTVCTTFPYYPEWRVLPEWRGKLSMDEVRNGVRILRSYSYVPNPVTSLKRIMHELSFVATSFLCALQQKKPDVLLAVSPPLGLAASAILLGKLWRIPYVFDVEDLQPDAAADLGMLPNWALRMLYALEKAAYRHATVVSTITKGMRSKILGKGVASDRVVLFEPRADESLLEIAPEQGVAFREKFGLEGKFIVTHSGNLGVKQGLDVILDAARMSRDDASLQYLIVGDGAARQHIERKAAEMALKNVRILPLLAEQEFRGLLAASDVCLVTQKRSVSDIVFPSKTVSYLAAGCAVVAAVNAESEVASAIVESGAGIVVEPENGARLLEGIYRLREGDITERRAQARAYARQRWSRARVLGWYERCLRAVAETRDVPSAG